MISQTQLVAKKKVEAVVTLTKDSPIDLHLVPPPPRVCGDSKVSDPSQDPGEL